MLNHSQPHTTSADVLGQISSYFSVVDNAVSVGDTNKRYTPTTNTCYGPPPPVQQGSFTTVVISPTADNTADIYNGYIYAEMSVSATISEGIGGNAAECNSPYVTWIGFKDAMDAIEKYEILANGITIYTQNQAIEESFVTSCGMPEARKRADLYSHARHEDIFERKFSGSSGKYLDWANSSSSGSLTKSTTIKLKIDLRRFLPLSNIKYLPAFAGKIELRLYFSTAGIVVAPVNPIGAFNNNYNLLYNYKISNVTTHFTPAGENFMMIVGTKAPTTLKSMVFLDGDGNKLAIPAADWSEQLEEETQSLIRRHEAGDFDEIPSEVSESEKEAVRLRNQIMDYLVIVNAAAPGEIQAGSRSISVVLNQVSKCETVINCFGIDSAIYNSLVARYSNMALTFPTQTLAFMPLSNPLSSSTSPKSSQTITPRFVDSIFLLFPLNSHYRSCYYNPLFSSLQIQCGGYGNIPDIACGTYNEPRVHESLQNALNLNNDTVCLSNEVVHSIDSRKDASLTGDTRLGLKSNDTSNFLIGFATETDGTFQQGQTSNTPITYTLNVGYKDDSNWYKSANPSVPILGILVDSTFSIQVRGDGAPPLCEIGAYDISSPVQ